ncbi:MAG: polysaccharide biosynthesis/export family protein [Sedimentisphaerales bacterium]|nr:polysaccharide biosynthesis/export family protein [Sedimentisphaerales bacterium]
MKSIEIQGKDRSERLSRKSLLYVAITCQLFLLTLLSGCGNKFWDPAQVGRFRPVPSVNVILDSLGVAEETDTAWQEGEEPRPADTVVMETDYTFKPGDVVRVSIFELLQQGVTAFNEYVVTETGKISIPEVGVVEVAGLTETQLEEEIKQILSPSILKEPTVTVVLVASQQRVFSIFGDGIPAPGRYGIPRYDYRLTDALAMAGGARQFNVSYVYVSRAASDQGTSPGMFDSNLGIDILEPPAGFDNIQSPGQSDKEMLEIIAPRAQMRSRKGSNVVIASTEMGTMRDFNARRRAAGYASAENLGGLLTGNSQVVESAGNPMAVGTEINGQPVTALVSEVEPAQETERSGAASVWQEPAEAEQVTVADILKTLAARSEAEKDSSASPDKSATISVPSARDVSAVDAPRSVVGSSLKSEPDRTVGDESGSVDAILKSLADRPRPVRQRDDISTAGAVDTLEPETGAGVGSADEPEGVESILRSLEARSKEQESPDQAEWQKVLESFAEPAIVEPKPGEDTNLDELLKSFAEPDAGTRMGETDIGVQIDEQVGTQDVNLDIGMPSEVVEEPEIGLEDLGISLSPGVGAGREGVQSPGRIEWVFQDGKWVPMQVGAATVAKPVIRVEGQEQPLNVRTEVPLGGMDWSAGVKTRLIKIPTDKLMAGDARYNIAIRPGDAIYVPVDVIGEFCVMGNVVRQGYIPITGRPLTLKMAIAAAGGLGPLAYPKRVEVTRRIGRKKEETVMVDLDKIASGELPDFFIKPNDLINVGTHSTSRWRAVLRNAFRATYGFGFVYDRNFALDNYYSSYGRTSRVDIGEAIKIF